MTDSLCSGSHWLPFLIRFLSESHDLEILPDGILLPYLIFTCRRAETVLELVYKACSTSGSEVKTPSENMV